MKTKDIHKLLLENVAMLSVWKNKCGSFKCDSTLAVRFPLKVIPIIGSKEEIKYFKDTYCSCGCKCL